MELKGIESQYPTRDYYLDNLKVFLICIVIVHHLAIAYGGEGLFIIESVTRPSILEVALLNELLAINQSYFMGSFFLISAYFSYGSLSRKGSKDFIKGKVRRLLLPSVVYFLIISPVIQVVIGVFYNKLTLVEIGYNPDIGPLWFLLALFMFDVLYAVVVDKLRYLGEIPSRRTTLVILVMTGFIAWMVRLIYPIGVTVPFLSFQLAHFPQYFLAYCFLV